MTKDNSENISVSNQKAPQQKPVEQVMVQPPKLTKMKATAATAKFDQKKSTVSAKEKSKSWYFNRYQVVSVQRNILLIFSIFAMIAVTVCVVFVKSVTASKSLEPYVIEIEEKTGIPVVVDQQTVQQYSGNQMMIRYFLNQFIQSASAYNSRTYKLDSLRVRLLSTAGVFSDYNRRIRPRDLTGTDIQVRIKSIQFPGKDTAQVRILRVVSTKNDTKSFNEVINIDYRFADLNLNSEERMINPLGFQVGRYLITEEVYEF